MYEFVVQVGNQKVRGAKVLVEPFRTWQLGDGQPPELDIVLGNGTGSATLKFYLTRNGTLIAVGGAAHIPWANGTYFPVFASVPGARKRPQRPGTGAAERASSVEATSEEPLPNPEKHESDDHQ
jgi:hypothetical protein